MNVFDLFATLNLDTKPYEDAMREEQSKTSSFGSKIGGALGKVAGIAAKATAAAVTAAAAGVAAISKQAIDSYAEYEQLVGGVETLFGDASKEVMANAQNAWKTAGLSTNEYMETVTSFAASLKQSTETESEAARIADQAVQDMSDNAAKMGTSMDSIQNAYQGFAKQNYTMLDNLKLGYGGTKSEMERLLADAEKLTGIHYDINQLDDVYNAIHVIQEDLGITGTTAKEAMHTIEGSANATKSAWQNVVTAIAGGGDLKEAFEGLQTAIFGDGSAGSGLLANIIPRIEQTLQGVGEFISQAAPLLSEHLPALFDALLPTLVESATSLVTAFVDTFPALVSSLLPPLLEAILAVLPQLTAVIPQIIMTIFQVITENLPTIINAGVQILLTLIDGLTKGIPQLIAMLPTIITTITTTLLNNLPLIIRSGLQMIVALAQGLVQAIPQLIQAVPQIISALISAFAGAIPELLSVGENIVAGIWNGISSAGSWLWSQITGWANSIVESIKSVFRIHSPSAVFRDEVGAMLAKGIGVGFDDEMDNVSDEMAKAIPTSFDTSVNLGVTKTGGVGYAEDSRPTVVQLVLDGRVIAEVVTKHQRTIARAAG